jgi:cell division protease FtsH
VHDILTSCLDDARSILTDHKDQMILLAETLVKKETLDDREIRKLLDLPASASVEEAGSSTSSAYVD